MDKFRLTDAFLDKYKRQKTLFGFNGLGELVYLRTYSRLKDNGENERWWETVQRVVEGTFNMQKRWIEAHRLGWSSMKAQKSAQEMYDRIFSMKFLPPGRGLWAMGSPITEERGLYMALNNCSFVSTINIKDDISKPFCFLMDTSMLGVGCGFDVKGEGKITVHKPIECEDNIYEIPDTREGWVESVKLLIESYLLGTKEIKLDYSKVRKAGEPIRGFGGVSSGAEPLKELHKGIRHVMKKNIGLPITTTTIVDIMNMIGKCVVAGNVRRCLPVGTLIHTKRGLVPIEKIIPNVDMAKTSTGYAEISERVYQGKQNVLTIQTQLGSLCCTAKHKIAKLKSPVEYEWVYAEDLTPGDRVVFVEGGIEGEFTTLPPFTYTQPNYSTTCRNITIPKLDASMAWFMGLFHGDGHVSPNFDDNGFNAYISVACSLDYPSIIEDCQAQLRRFGVNLCNVEPSESDKCLKVRSQSKQLAWYLSQFKTANTEIEVPVFIMRGTIDIRRAYLAGLFDADGSKRNRPVVAVSSVYPSYLKQIQALYASVGIPVRLKLRRETSVNWRALYQLTVVGQRAKEKFKETILPYAHSKDRFIRNKTKRSQNDYSYPSKWVKNSTNDTITVSSYLQLGNDNKSLVPVEVLSISTDDVLVETYDISVPLAKEFVCQEGLLVHNTAEIVFGDYKSQEYLDLKNYTVNPHREDYGWTSNNSIFCDLGMNYAEAAKRTQINGEPGYAWLHNMQSYSRMNNGPDNKDWRVSGGNPCFSGDTLIAVADGRGAVSIKQLANEEKDIPVYSLNKNGVAEIKYGRNPRKTRTNAELLEIEFEDGSRLKCTPDHKMLLLNGETCASKDLKPGDSLPRFFKNKEKMTAKNPNFYWRMYTNTNNMKSNKIMEHRMIARFFYDEAWSSLYDNEKKSGWLKGGIVVHHKDYDGLNNNPANLEIMAFKDHCQFHIEKDNVGENNPMFGKKHSEKSKKLIGMETKKRCENSQYITNLSLSHSVEERKNSSSRMKESKKNWDKDYYIKQAKTTDLDTVWIGERLYAKKSCIICNCEMILDWSKRHAVFCSHSCQNKHESGIKKRTEGLRVTFENKQRDTLHKQMMIFKDLKNVLNRYPLKKEWAEKCEHDGVSFRIRTPNSKTNNSYALTSYSELIEKESLYNHRVKCVRKLNQREDVYNITVDDNYTVAVVTESSANSLSGIYLHQCLEQSLESYEVCNLVETFPFNHENLEDYLITLKYAYLYAKTVTLGETHWPETNRVMLRNRRIGCSMSGIVQFVAARGLHELKRWCEDGYKKIEYYDEVYSDWLAIPKSIKKTSVKPSGCQVGNTYVITSEGLLRLDEIGNIDGDEWQKHDMFICKENSISSSTRFYKNGCQPTKKITLSSGIELECTLDHKYRVMENHSYVWKSAKELTKNDIVPYRLGGYIKNIDTELKLLDWPRSRNTDKILNFVKFEQPRYLNSDLAWFIGLYFADGSNHKKGIRISGNINQIETLEKANRIVKEQFNIDGCIYLRTKSENNADLYINNTGLVWWLEQHELKKQFCENIKVPPYIRRSSRKSILSFIDGFKCGDGCRLTNGDSFVTVSKQFAIEMVILMRAVGIDAKMRDMPPTDTSYGNLMRYWISERNSRWDKSKWRYIHNDTKEMWEYFDKNNLCYLSFDTISKIEDGESFTYDIEVPEENTYVANSVISHNTVSLLAGATPGVHYPENVFYIRRIRLSKHSDLIEPLKEAGYKIEPCFGSEETTVVVEMPVKIGNNLRSVNVVSIWEQLALAAFMQRYWADNQVSCTVTFGPDEVDQLEPALNLYQYQLKGISFLPQVDSKKSYRQMPYESITSEQYEKISVKLKPIVFRKVKHEQAEVERFCNNDSCTIK